MPKYRPITEAELKILPQLKKTTFRCPTCSIVAQMEWHQLSLPAIPDGTVDGSNFTISVGILRVFLAAFCQAKGCVSIWMEQGDSHNKSAFMIYPRTNTAPPPPDDLPESAKVLYVEAGNIMAGSPRAAAALLRMCTEDIIKELSKKKDAENTIAPSAGLHRHIEFLRKNDELWPGGAIDIGLDALRVIGNDAVHSTEIRGDDDQRTVEGLFRLVLMITDTLIARRREAEEFEQLIAKPTRGKEIKGKN